MEIDINYWFYLEPYVYANVKGSKILLYNTLDHACIIKDNEYLASIIKSVLIPDNCGVISLNLSKNHSNELYSFINEIRDKFMGDIIPINLSSKKPVQPLPIAHIRQEMKKMKGGDNELQGVDVLKYLFEISIFLNNSCEHGCEYCLLYHKQFPFCTKYSNSDNSFSFNNLVLIVSYITKYNFDRQINLFGGDYTWLIDNEDKVRDILYPIIDKCKVFCYQKSLNTILSCGIFSKEQIVLLVDYPVHKDIHKYIIEDSIKNINIIVRNKMEFSFFETELRIYGNSINVTYFPFYNKANSIFFQEHVFLNENDILKNVVNMKNIHQNMTLNMYFFGKLIITANGDIYTNINDNVIGDISNNLLDVVYNALTVKNSSWMKIRNRGKCKGCLFQYLCPPISNYESIFNRYNLCQIIKE